MKKRDRTISYALLQAVLWGSFGAAVAFAASWFDAYGIDASRYGLLLCAACGAAILLQLVLAELISRLPKLTVQAVLICMGAVMLACSAVLVFAKGKLPVAALCACFCVSVMIVQILPSMINSLGMAAERAGFTISYGISRGIGSLGYAGVSYLTGAMISLTDERACAVIQAVLAAALIVLAVTFPGVKDARQRQEKTPGTLWRDGRFLLMLLGATLVYLSHNFLCNFLYYAVKNCGGDEASQGVCTFISAVCELPVMFLFAFMLRKIRCDSWLKLSGLFVALRAFTCFLASTVGGLYAAMFCQLLGFGLFSVTSVRYVDRSVGTSDTVRGQTMLAATCTLSNLLTYPVGGVLVERTGIRPVLLLAAVLGALGTLIFIFCLRKIPLAQEGGLSE